MTNQTTSLRLQALYRYPVKGLSPEPLQDVVLEPDSYFPGDRLFAIENGPSGFDPADPKHEPKIKFLMLMRNEALARLATRYEPSSGILTIRSEGRVAAEGALHDPEGRRAIEDFLKGYLPDALRGEPRLLCAPDGFRFTDSPRGFVSLINLASVAALEDMTGAAVDPLRFRANLHLTGLAAFAELDLVGRTIAGPDGTALRIIKRTERCAATNVDPSTGIRDLTIPRTLDHHLGHTDCGVYAEVLRGGALTAGAELTLDAA